MSKRHFLSCVFLLSAASYVPVLGAQSTQFHTVSSEVNEDKASFGLPEKTQVPGGFLQPGRYSIHVVDHLSDRMIVRVDFAQKKKGMTFLALPSGQLRKASSSQGPIVVSADGKSALRGFSFPDGTAVEFVYPKAEAVTLAKRAHVAIAAIDPSADGIRSDSDLSPEDMQMVTLWMLTPTEVEPGKSGPSITAAKYQPPQKASLPNEVAENGSPSGPPMPKNASSHVQAMTSLPHTAGSMEWVWFAGMASLLGALMMTFRRSRRSATGA